MKRRMVGNYIATSRMCRPGSASAGSSRTKPPSCLRVMDVSGSVCVVGLNETSVCLCGQTDEDMHHVLWSCPLYDDLRSDMLSGIKVLQVGPVYYADLVGTQANFRRFVEYARAWHGLRGGQK
ncbi:hypothetical protein EVAR_89987_1 [Eumeta japonica]|uniref:Retrovirus-related Pol polyprotein from type-1 retrotransposable element R1 2 n=1 Tax=Eumeta variegata TaxID=151549 RepID=A0A4C2AA23_EUMVA|nr:hypothetical protein EVAR_89987_1 [Eumeta japonica]